MIALSYLWILAIVPLVTEKNDPEVQWHAKHGLVLFVAEIILFMVLAIAHFIPFLGWIFGCVTIVLPLLLLIFHIVLIMKAENGQRVIIPGISEFADRF
jgi:uncharacterized membrane protein